MRTLIAFALLLLAASSTLAAPAPIPKTPRPYPNRQDVQRLQGEWVVFSCHSHSGMRVHIYESRRNGPVRTAFIAGNVVRWRDSRWYDDDGQVFTLDAGSRPKTIDFTSTDSDTSARGIYRFEGDTLTICLTYLNRTRPASFDLTRAGEQLIVLRRR
jgi:uncharacterized protein (TIGR03067 family)